MKSLWAVVSVYNEEEALPLFFSEIKKVPMPDGWTLELLFVNDGSRDKSEAILQNLAAADSSVHVISFSRNFGHESAMLAGLMHAGGDAALFLDADLQHPVCEIPEILKLLDGGADIVLPVRKKNPDASVLSAAFSAGFYKIFNLLGGPKLAPGVSDFFCMNKAAACALRQRAGKALFLRGVLQNIGFSRAYLFYDAEKRQAGESKYSFLKLLKFSLRLLISHTKAPVMYTLGCAFVSIFLFAFFLTCLGFGADLSAFILPAVCLLFAMAFSSLAMICFLLDRSTQGTSAEAYIIRKMWNL